MVTKVNLKVFSDRNVAVSCERTTHRYGDNKYHFNKGYINTLFNNVVIFIVILHLVIVILRSYKLRNIA